MRQRVGVPFCVVKSRIDLNPAIHVIGMNSSNKRNNRHLSTFTQELDSFPNSNIHTTFLLVLEASHKCNTKHCNQFSRSYKWSSVVSGQRRRKNVRGGEKTFWLLTLLDYLTLTFLQAYSNIKTRQMF